MKIKWCVILISIFLNACAFDLMHVKQLPAQLDTKQEARSSFVLEKEETIDLGTGYTRVLKAGTSWNYVGKIENGDVFKTKDQILTVEASNIHEAYIVVSSEKIVGFYLPVEKTFSPLSTAKTLKIRAATNNL
jgi:hypothetical protein